jgi:hypothetical protein
LLEIDKSGGSAYDEWKISEIKLIFAKEPLHFYIIYKKR